MGKIAVTERVTGHTELIGLIAYPIRHSMSPTMHNEAFKKLGLDYVYVCFEVDNSTLEDTVKGLRAMKVRGWNVSMPNKGPITQYLDKLSPASQIIGAGGAATAIEVQAALDGVRELTIFNRADEFYAHGEETVKKLRERTDCIVNIYPLEDHAKLKEELDSADIYIDSTSCGMKPLEDVVAIPDKSYLRPDLVVMDTVYAPRQTKLMKWCDEVGCKNFNGLGMMLYQGAAAFKLWTGKEMPVDFIKDVLF